MDVAEHRVLGEVNVLKFYDFAVWTADLDLENETLKYFEEALEIGVLLLAKFDELIFEIYCFFHAFQVFLIDILLVRVSCHFLLFFEVFYLL